jgi:hypothetical protein
MVKIHQKRLRLQPNPFHYAVYAALPFVFLRRPAVSLLRETRKSSLPGQRYQAAAQDSPAQDSLDASGNRSDHLQVPGPKPRGVRILPAE